MTPSSVQLELAHTPIFGMPEPLCAPLGLAYLNGSLRRAGFESRGRDLAARMWREERALHDRLFAVAMPEAGGYYGVDLPLLLESVEPGYFSGEAHELGALVHDWGERVAEDGPPADLVFVHVVDANIYAAAAYGAARRARGSRVLFGGPGVRLDRVRRLLLRVGAADFALVGEGEEAVVSAARALAEGQLDAWDHPGLSKWTAEGLFEREPAPLARIHDLPWPDFTSIELYDCLPVMAARGCIRDCSFCSERFFWSRYRLRKVPDVLAELEHQQAQWGPKRVFFHDDLVNGNPKWLRRLSEGLVERGSPWTWDCYMEPYRLDASLAALVAKSGLVYVRMGVEHLSEPMLQTMGRVGTLSDIETSLAVLSDEGVTVFFDLIVGHPGETEDHHRENVEAAVRIVSTRPQLGVSINPFSLLDGAPTGRDPAAYGVETLAFDPQTLPSRWQSLRDLAATFLQQHVQTPGRDVVRRRANELEAAVRAAGRRTNLTRREMTTPAH